MIDEKSLVALEELLRQGETARVRKTLNSIIIKSIPRNLALKSSNLARRVGLNSTALRILNPIVRPKTSSVGSASFEEMAEYSGALIRIGAVGEARKLLSTIPEKGPAVGDLFQAYALFSQWEYSEAAPFLKRALEKSNSEDLYFQSVINVNLASAFIFLQKYDEAIALLGSLSKLVRKNSFRILEGNVLELSAQASLFQQDYTGARDYLDKARSLLSDSDSLDYLYVEKWLALCDLHEIGLDNEIKKNLDRIRGAAYQKQHWETLRDLDYHIFIKTHSQDVLERLFHGTPFFAYRERLKVILGDTNTVSSTYMWTPVAHWEEINSPLPRHWINVATQDCSKPISNLPRGRLLHRLLIQLTADFYRPAPLGVIFSAMFPEEYFNPDSSPNRIHQGIRKLRIWLSNLTPALDIEERDGTYQLKGNGKFGLLVGGEVGRSRSGIGKNSLFLETFSSATKLQEFSASDFAATLSISLSTATRVLREAMAKGSVVKFGSGPKTRYGFKKAG